METGRSPVESSEYSRVISHDDSESQSTVITNFNALERGQG
jgi:hypothetical protein